MNWDVILGGVLPAIVSSGIFTWLLQKFIEHKCERRLEKYGMNMLRFGALE
jgi:hypothetical protein